jgi:hypothetical protein
MKTLKLTLLASAMLLGGMTVKAQSADDVVNKYIKAVGGEDAWKKVTSIKKTGTVSIQGNEGKLILTQVDKKGFRMDLGFDIPGMGPINNYLFVTPTEGYMFFPIQGQTEPKAMSADEVKEMQEGLNVADEVLALKQKGTKMEYVGKEKVDEKDAHKLKYVEDGNPVFLYFDAATNYLVKRTATVEAQGQKMEMAATYKDYQKTPEGISVAMGGTDPQLGDFTYTSVEVNKPVEEGTFKVSK